MNITALKLYLLLSLLVLGSSVVASEALCNKELKVHLDLHAPSAYLNDQQRVVGMDADMANLILTEAGCQISWHLLPMTGARIIRSLQDGEFDVMVRASNTAERREYAYFSQAYRQEVVGLFSHKRDGLPASLTLEQAQAEGRRLIGPASGWYGEHFQRLRARWQELNLYTPYPDAAKATELFFARPSRGELVLVDADIFFQNLGPDRYDSVVLNGSSLIVTPAHLMIRKGALDTTDLAAINQAIETLLKEGRLQQLENRYRPLALQRMLPPSLFPVVR